MTLEEIASTLSRIEHEVYTIKRGVYGDKENGKLGLIETDLQQHERLKKLEDFRKKAIYLGTGAIAVIEVLAHIDNVIAAIMK